MHLRRKALLVVVAILATLAAPGVFASIPRSDIFSPAITRTSFDLVSPARPERSGVLPLVEHLRGALENALPASGQLSSLAETRVRAFDDLAPFEQQKPSELSRVLREASRESWAGIASGESFAGGDPVNGRDPTGECDRKKGESWWDFGTRCAQQGLGELGSAAENFGAGVGNRIAGVANLIYNFGKPDVQEAIREEIQSTIDDAQDPMLGHDPADRLMRRKANQIENKRQEFLAAPKAKQQQMIGAGAFDVAAALAPAAKAAPVSIETAPPMWQDYLAAAKERAAVSRASFGISDEVADGLVGSIHRDIFFEAFPELERKVWVHHAIERQVAKRYPGVFTPQEIEILENYRGIPNEVNNRLHLSEIRIEWNEFYRTHPVASREQIMQKVIEIDQKYGAQFNPPITSQ